MKGIERAMEKTESIGNGLNEMKKSSTFRSAVDDGRLGRAFHTLLTNDYPTVTSSRITSTKLHILATIHSP